MFIVRFFFHWDFLKYDLRIKKGNKTEQKGHIKKNISGSWKFEISSKMKEKCFFFKKII